MDEPTDVWMCYECIPSCVPGENVFVELRVPRVLPVGIASPRVPACPLCGAITTLRATWDATHSGYGSSGDISEGSFRAIMGNKLAILRTAVREAAGVLKHASGRLAEFEALGEKVEGEPLAWKSCPTGRTLLEEWVADNEESLDSREGMARRLEATARDMRAAVVEGRTHGPGRVG